MFPWNRIEVWFSGSRPQAMDDTAMPARVWVCVTQATSGLALWIAPWITYPALLMP